MKKILYLIIPLFLHPFNTLKSEEKLYAVKTISNFHMNSSLDSPVIYPVDQGKEMVLLGKENNWLNLLDSKTGLVGWSLDENFSKDIQNLQKKNARKIKSSMLLKMALQDELSDLSLNEGYETNQKGYMKKGTEMYNAILRVTTKLKTEISSIKL